MEVNPTKTIELIGYTAVVNGQPALSPTVDLGTENSYGVEYLQLKFGEGWGDLTITATFTAPDKTSTDAVVDINGLVEVPHEATCHGSGRGVIVFKGCRNGVQLISCDVGSFVTAHGPVNGSESAEPTPDKWQQFVDEVQDDREAANKAAQDAAASADRAEAAAENAENAAQTAADAAGAARQAAGVAGSAANASSTSAGEAAQSAKAAETAKQRAEDAAKKALEAKTGSENALQDADAAKDAASGYADAAAEKATAAAKSENSAADSAAAAKKSADDADNTANSIKDSMTQISENKEAVSKLKEDTTALQKRQNVLVGSETGNPISCNDAYSAPLCGLTVYGKSTQDGTPTHDAPVPIVSAGDGGSVVVKVSDGNGKEQTLTLPTPNGLPGIPVTSGGNYTDQNGQQWVCDEVDLERGVRVQMVTTMVFSDSSGFAASSTTNGIRFLRAVKNLKITDTATADANAFCSALALGANGGTWLTPDVFTITKTALYVRFKNITSLGELQQYLQQTPMSLTAILATPIETPLFPAEIAAYKALTAYAPDTVVQASDGAGIKLDYQRDVNLVVKNLEDAIASMTTT